MLAVIPQCSTMACSRGFYVTLVLALLGDAFCIPAGERLPGNHIDQEDDIQAWLAGYGQNKPRDLEPANSDVRVARQDGKPMMAGDSNEGESRVQPTTARPEFATPVNDDDDDDDDDFDTMNTAPSGGGGGSNILSLLRLATALFPSSSGANQFMIRMLRRYVRTQLNTNVPIFNAIPNYPTNYPPPYNPTTLFLRRNDVDVTENRVDIDDIQGLQPPLFQRQETDEDSGGDNGTDEESDENNAAESVEDDNGNGNNNGNGNSNGNASKQKSGSTENDKENDDNNSDYSDEPPEGDGQGGGILGILAGLSGGEDGSDLGTLLATISGIVANLSGDGFDLNALIGSGIGLFVGLLSEGEENPGAVIASYLLTSLDTITGGGSKNNGAFFGKFLSKLIRGTSAGGDPDASLEEGKEPEKDSAGFLGSFFMALLGEMSKGSSKSSSCGSSCGHPDGD